MGAVAALAVRDHRRSNAERRTLFAKCQPLLTESQITIAMDGFPRLNGRSNGLQIVGELIPDTMTIKRLPQLWLSLSMLERLPICSSVAVLVRPSGNDYYSLTETFRSTLQPPRALPWEVLVRGEGKEAQGLIDALGSEIGAVLSCDPRVKEVCVTPKGVRIIRQAAEGRRGEHLLLRQAAFDVPAIDPSQFTSLLSTLRRLHSFALTLTGRPEVAA